MLEAVATQRRKSPRTRYLLHRRAKAVECVALASLVDPVQDVLTSAALLSSKLLSSSALDVQAAAALALGDLSAALGAARVDALLCTQHGKAGMAAGHASLAPDSSEQDGSSIALTSTPQGVVSQLVSATEAVLKQQWSQPSFGRTSAGSR